MKIGFLGTILLAALVNSASAASAIELHQIEFKTGTDGLRRSFLTINNDSQLDISCHANLAHWYSLDALSITARSKGRIELWFEPASGAFILLNEKLENMPVETLWCGVKGRAYETRSSIALNADNARHNRTVSCTGREARIFCQ